MAARMNVNVRYLSTLVCASHFDCVHGNVDVLLLAFKRDSGGTKQHRGSRGGTAAAGGLHHRHVRASSVLPNYGTLVRPCERRAIPVRSERLWMCRRSPVLDCLSLPHLARAARVGHRKRRFAAGKRTH